jgi:hypothetical protein
MASTGGKHKKSFSFRAMLSPRPQESTLPHALFDKRDFQPPLSATLNGSAGLSASGRPPPPPPRPLSYAPPAISVAAVIAGKELDASQRSQTRSPPASPSAGARPLSYVPPAVTVAQAAQAIAEKAAQALAEKELDASQRAHTAAARAAAAATATPTEVATTSIARPPAAAAPAPMVAPPPAPAAVVPPAAVTPQIAVAPPPAAVAQQDTQAARPVAQPVAQAEAIRHTEVKHHQQQYQYQQQQQQQQPALSPSPAAVAAAPAPPLGSPRNLSTASLRNSFSAAQCTSRGATESGASPRSNASSPRHRSVPALLPFSPKHSAYNHCSDPERYASLRSPRSSTGGIGIGTLNRSGFTSGTAAAGAGVLTGALGTVLDANEDSGRVTCSDDGSGESTVQGWSRGDIKARMRRPRMSLKRLRQHTAWLNSLGVWPRELGESLIALYYIVSFISILFYIICVHCVMI